MIYLLTVENLNDAHHANSFTGRTVTAFKPSHGGGLTLLRAAYDAAQTLKRDVWEFAVEIEQLHALGVTNTALRLLLCEGYAIHAVERTSAQRVGCRLFRKVTSLALPSRTCFVLADKGLHLSVRELDQATLVSPSQHLQVKGVSFSMSNRPFWDGTLRQLSWNGLLVKHFRLPAINQEAILAALEEECWPPHIDDPLPPVAGLDPKVRLHDAIKNLNRNQINPALTFRGDGSGQGVLWYSDRGSVPSPDLPRSSP